MELRVLRKLLGYSVKGFAEYLDVPLRTYEKWDRGERCPPDYVCKMIVEILIIRGNISREDNIEITTKKK